MKDLAQSVWLERPIYEEAEIAYYERLQQGGTETLTPLAGEVAKARQRLIESRDTFKEATGGCCNTNIDVDAQKFMEKKVVEFDQTFKQILSKLDSLCLRVEKIEKQFQGAPKTAPQVAPQAAQKAQNEDDDDVDLFGSDDEEEDAAAAKIREERLAAYAAKKSKKPALIAKSNVILDVKPWDDETDMKALEAAVRKIECDGLLWGTSKLVPLAYGIHKLTISCVVEDEKVSIDWLTEQIEANEDYIQSVDIAAFNKI